MLTGALPVDHHDFHWQPPLPNLPQTSSKQERKHALEESRSSAFTWIELASCPIHRCIDYRW